MVRFLLFSTLAALSAAVILADSVSAAPVTFDFAHIGNAGNMADPETGFGAVSYNYAISRTEVTNAQYTEFLNAVAATDANNLYNTSMGLSTSGGIIRTGAPGSYSYAVKTPAVGQGPGGTDYHYDDKPVVYVSFFDAMRFVNWLHNGQGSGGTESGVYNISDGLIETRSASAKFWIPSEDEWYKAAYYDPNGNGGSGGHYDYPTSTDSPPNNNLPLADTGNSANFYDGGYSTGDFFYPMTDVGAYSLSKSPYGTFDQGGNVWEWNEAVIRSSFRGFRGGSWNESSSSLAVGDQTGGNPTSEDSRIGFRVATVPEPSAVLLAALAAVGLLCRRRV